MELRSTFSRLLNLMLKLSPHICLPSILLLSRDSLEVENHDGASLVTGTSSYGRGSPNTVGNSIASQILKQFKNSSRLCESMLSSYENVLTGVYYSGEWFPNNSKIKRPRERRKSLAVGKVYSSFEGYIHGWNACINAADLSQGLVSIWTGGNRGNTTEETMPKLNSISKSFKILGGLSRPKLIECYDVDGNTYTQIVKAGDDMRQDEVVEQAFSVLNYLLRRDHKCRDRKLILRTYNIAPLSSNVGVIEFAGTNTTAVGDFLLKAHSRLRPNDRPAAKVSETLRSALNKSPKSRIKSYINECKTFKPCMYDEMIVRCPDSRRWYKNRLAFTRSVAVNSMVGYIIGLGDRHVSNILIDKNTYEVIHIDFGILFEKGKQLATPETVPFRLTRDFVDGMGLWAMKVFSNVPVKKR